MALEYIFLKGKGSWISPHKLNQWGKWSMCLHPDNESLELIRDLQTQGIKNVIGKDDDGYFVRLTRPCEIKVNSQMVGLKSPDIFDGSKPLEDGSFLPLDGVLIGNGSDVVVKMEVYQHRIPQSNPPKKAKAMRWHSLRVDNLVPYAPKRDFDADRQLAVEGFDKQPKQLW